MKKAEKKNEKKKGFWDFVLRAMLWGGFCVLFTLLFCIITDPYSVFHVDAIQDNGVEANKNYIKMHYILENPDKFDAYMFGNSHVSSIHVEKLNGVHCYNMTYSSGAVWEHAANLRTMLANGVTVKRVYMGLDSTVYTSDFEGRENDPMRVSYEYSQEHPIKFFLLQMDTARVFRSLNTSLKHQKSEDFAKIFYEYGWSIGYEVPGLEWLDENEIAIGESPIWEEQIDRVLQSVREMKELCDANGIEFVVFTNPMLWNAYLASEEKGYARFLTELAQITDYYNFSGLNRVSLEKANYIDPSHYNAATGDLLIKVFNGEGADEDLSERGFGMYVTKDNVEELLQILQKADEEFR